MYDLRKEWGRAIQEESAALMQYLWRQTPEASAAHDAAMEETRRAEWAARAAGATAPDRICPVCGRWEGGCYHPYYPYDR